MQPLSASTDCPKLPAADGHQGAMTEGKADRCRAGAAHVSCGSVFEKDAELESVEGDFRFPIVWIKRVAVFLQVERRALRRRRGLRLSL